MHCTTWGWLPPFQPTCAALKLHEAGTASNGHYLQLVPWKTALTPPRNITRNGEALPGTGSSPVGHTVWGYLAGRAPSPSAGCSLTAGPAPARLQALVPPGTRRGAPLPHPASSAPAVRSWCRRSVCLSSSAGAHRLGSWGSWIEKLQTDKFCHGATLLQGSTHAPGSPKPLHGSILQKNPHKQPIPAAACSKNE